MGWLVGVDVGGTFTDFYAVNTDTGESVVHKAPSSPEDSSKTIVSGLDALGEDQGVPVSELERFAHGTTVATNALIQRRGGRMALITTRGFKDLLEIGRQIRPKIYDLQADYPPALVPRERRFEVTERIGSMGEEITPLSDDEIARVVDEVIAANVDSVAICLLFSFLNADHETRIAEKLRSAAPGLHVSVSCEVQPEFREYERMSTTVLNGFLQPEVSHYMNRLRAELAVRLPAASLGINQSNGGLMSIGQAAAYPIRTALSGPAAGVVGAVATARRSGIGNVITLDMGGTSTDVCLIRDHEAQMTTGREVAGFPVRLPAVDIHTIGAGGGSIASFGADGLLMVGPDSAGAVPGPACYDRGGTLPTVSDANLVLGRLPRELVGGGMVLDEAAARASIEPVAATIGVSIEQAAMSIARIVASNMVRAIRLVSIERGHDPREFALMPFGGAGGLHAFEVALEMGIGQLLVPLAPGILCAEGLVVSDLKEDFVATCRTPLADDLSAIHRELDRLVSEADDWFTREAVSDDRRQLNLVADMRYIGQNYELGVVVPGSRSLELPGEEALRQMFFDEHLRAYGHFDPDAPVEVINLRLSALGKLRHIETAALKEKTAGSQTGSRTIWFDESGGLESAVWHRNALVPGAIVPGPAVIEQFDATTLVPPGAAAKIDEAGNMIIGLTA